MARHHQQTYTSNGLPIVLMEDPLLHTADHPFCSDLSCPCHRDHLLIAEVHQKVAQGLLTAGEATRVVMGLQV